LPGGLATEQQAGNSHCREQGGGKFDEHCTILNRMKTNVKGGCVANGKGETPVPA
jgi:hypothetical protein